MRTPFSTSMLQQSDLGTISHRVAVALDGASMANKPWLTPAERVQCLKGKGVAFELMSEVNTEAYLRANSNYFRVASYRHGFPHVVGGKNDGKYINLDFAMLQDLSVIDYLLRKTMLPITIDVEHFAKMELLRIIEVHQEDGYQIVQDFLDSETVVKDDGSRHCHILHEIQCPPTAHYRDVVYA